MPFPYYERLSQTKKRIYDRSNTYKSFPFTETQKAKEITSQLKKHLDNSNVSEINRSISDLSNLICQNLNIVPVSVKIKAKRPSNHREELLGLYEMEEGKYCRITIWMKTSQKEQTVAFKTFLRTVLHELIHHLDYYYFKLADSLHTEGFFIRESNLFKEIVHPSLITNHNKPSPKTTKTPLKPAIDVKQLTFPF